MMLLSRDNLFLQQHTQTQLVSDNDHNKKSWKKNKNNDELLIGAAIPMVSMAQSQSAANWRNTHTQVDRTRSLTVTHLHQHSYHHFVRNASSVLR